MNKFIMSFLKLRIPLFVFLLFYLVFIIATYKSYGISFDEQGEYLKGKLFYEKIRGNDRILQEDFVIWKGEFNRELIDHNHFHHLLEYIPHQKLQIILEKFFGNTGIYETYHFENLVFAGLIFIAAYELLLRATKTKIFPTIGIIFLFLTPRYLGDVASNPKDIPFAVYYFISLSLIYLSLGWNEKIRILILGLSFGMTQANRIVGYSIYPIFIVFRLMMFFIDSKKTKKHILSFLCSFLFEVVLIALVGYLVHMITLPYLGADPFNHLIHLFTISKAYPWSGALLFFGKEYLAQNPFLLYLPVWIGITTPLFILLLSLVFSVFQIKNKVAQLLLISLSINGILYIVLRPVLYDGLRHMVYLLPQITILSVFGLITILKLKNKILKYILLLIVVLNGALVVNQYVLLHPYEYIYFNELVGGIRGAHTKFETDYWSTSFTDGSKWLKDYLKENNIISPKIGVCGSLVAVEYYLGETKYSALESITTRESSLRYDYVICWDRFADHEKIQGTVIHTVSREGVPLTYIYAITKK